MLLKRFLQAPRLGQVLLWAELGWPLAPMETEGICSVLLFFVIPGLGPILGAGPVIAWIVAGLENAVAVEQ